MEKNLDDGNGLQGSFSQKQTKSKTSAWLVLLDRDVFERWCAFARDLGLSPGRLAPVLLDVAMGLSPLPLRGDVVRTRSRSASNEEAKKAAAICTEAGEASTTVSVCDIKEESTNPEDGNVSARLIVKEEEDPGEVSTTSISCMEGLGVVDKQDCLASSQSKTRMPIETENKDTGSLELSAVNITQDVLRSIPDDIDDDDDDEADGIDNNNKDEGTGRQANNADQEIDLKQDGVEVEETKRHVTKKERKRPERLCPFCNIFLKGTLSRHIWRKHRDREEVISASKLPRKERLRQFDKFRKEGIFKANKALAMTGEANKEYHREKRYMYHSKSKLLMCGKCKGFYSSRGIGRHKKMCQESLKKLNDISASLLMADPNNAESSKPEIEEDSDEDLTDNDDDNDNDPNHDCIPHQLVQKDNGPMEDDRSESQINNADQETIAIDLKLDGVEEEEAKRHVTKKEEKRPERLCPFCNKFLKGKLSRHIWSNHRDREEVISASKLPRKERLLQFDKFKKEGIFKANKALVIAGEDNTDFYREKRHQSKAKLVMCRKCKGFYSSNTIHRHKKGCEKESLKKLSNVPVSRLIPYQDRAQDHSFSQDVLCLMKDDEIGTICRTNPIIRTVGRQLWQEEQQTFSKAKDTKKKVVASMRQLASLYVIFQEMENKVGPFEGSRCAVDMLSIGNFKHLAAAVKIFCQNQQGESMKSLKCSIFFLLKRAGKIMKASYLLEEEDAKARDMDRFLNVLSINQYSSFWDTMKASNCKGESSKPEIEEDSDEDLTDNDVDVNDDDNDNDPNHDSIPHRSSGPADSHTLQSVQKDNGPMEDDRSESQTNNADQETIAIDLKQDSVEEEEAKRHLTKQGYASKKRCKGESSKSEREEDYNEHLSVDDDVPGDCIPHQSSGPADDSHTLRSVQKDNGQMEDDRSESQTNNADQETIAIDLKQDGVEEKKAKRRVTKKEKKTPERLCPFCDTFLKGRLSRHILRKHRDREEVISASKLPRKERLLQFDKFKKEGIFKANKALAMAGEDNTKFYMEKRHRSKVKLVMCGKCKGFYSSRYIGSHKKGCEKEPHKNLFNVPVSRLISYQDRAEDQSFSQDVLCLIKNDEIGIICRTDPMIWTIGRQLWQEGQQTFSKRKELKARVVRSMRQLASLYLITKEMENEVGAFEELNQCAVDMLSSRNFKHLASAVEIYCQNPQGEVKTSVKQGLYFSLKKAAKIMKAYYLMEDKDGKAGDMDNFLEVFSANWHSLFREAMDCRNKSRKGESTLKAETEREEDDTEDLSDDDDD